MRETYQPPAASPAGPPHDRTLEETAPLSPSTETDTIRQSPTNHNENSCPRVTHAHTHELPRLRHSRSLPRHSREGGNPPPCVQTPKETPPPALYKIRHNPTESDKNQQKFVCARTLIRARELPHTHHPYTPQHHPYTLPRHSRTLPRHSRTLPRHSREGGNPLPPTRTAPTSQRTLGGAAPESLRQSIETNPRKFPLDSLPRGMVQYPTVYVSTHRSRPSYDTDTRGQAQMTTNDRPAITLSTRQVVGKKVRALRREGIIPVHYYGKHTASQTLQAQGAILRKVVDDAGANVPVEVSFEGKEDSDICFVREVQWHPVNGSLLHVDFMRVDIAERVTAEVPVVITGQSEAVRDLGGILIQPFYTLPVEALPLDMPKAVTVDITPLRAFGNAVRVGDIELQEGISILRDPDDLLATIQGPRVEEEATAEEDDVDQDAPAADDEAGAEESA